ncbi:hypothetical protein [Muricauda sp. NFXS6]
MVGYSNHFPVYAFLKNRICRIIITQLKS